MPSGPMIRAFIRSIRLSSIRRKTDDATLIGRDDPRDDTSCANRITADPCGADSLAPVWSGAQTSD